MSQEDEDGFLGQTPAAKFIHTFWKGGKRDHHKEKAGNCCHEKICFDGYLVCDISGTILSTHFFPGTWKFFKWIAKYYFSENKKKTCYVWSAKPPLPPLRLKGFKFTASIQICA